MNPIETLKVVLDTSGGTLLTATVDANLYLQGRATPVSPTLEVRTLHDSAVVTGIGTTWTREASAQEGETRGEFFVPVYEDLAPHLPFTVSVDRYRAVIYQLYLAMSPSGMTDAGLLVRTVTPFGQTVLRAAVTQARGKDGFVFQLPMPERSRSVPTGP